VLYSLKLISAQLQPGRPFIADKLDREIDELILHAPSTARSALLIVTKMWLYKWSFGRRSPLTWTDVIVSGTAISAAVLPSRDGRHHLLGGSTGSQ